MLGKCDSHAFWEGGVEIVGLVRRYLSFKEINDVPSPESFSHEQLPMMVGAVERGSFSAGSIRYPVM